MTTRFRTLALCALAAGLLSGPAVRAQGTAQTSNVSYALTLIDAGANGTGNSKTGGPVTDATEYVRVKVTVSIPRSAGSSAYGDIPANASPARLMYRAHRGPATAFDGSIALTRDAPYRDASGTPMTTAFYPMPQATTSATGVAISQTDPTQLNYAGVASRSTTNALGQAYADYLAPGRVADPARWECTFLSPAYAIADIEADADGQYAMLRSLLNGEATYEWYAASRYGLGSFARISDIQDLGRKLSFTDVRLWVPETDDAVDWDAAVSDSDSIRSLGERFAFRLAAMPNQQGMASTWRIRGGAVGDSNNGNGGLHLLNAIGGDASGYSDYPRVESPFYPDGIASVTFQAAVPGSDPDGTPQELLVQCSTDGGTRWAEVERITLAASGFNDYTVDFEAQTPSGNAATRFRIVRLTQSLGEGQANLGTVAIRDLIVRSAAPKADFGVPICVSASSAAAEPYATEPFEVLFRAEGDAKEQPRGYEAAMRLRRRAEGDTTRVWRDAAVTVSESSSGNATFSAAFTPGTLLMNPDGTVNAAEGAFFLAADGTVSGLRPGVYDLALDYAILGSFAAGREEIDARERVEGTLTTYPVTIQQESGQTTTVQKPFLVDVREHQTLDESAFLRITYRGGIGTDQHPYTIQTLDVPLLPASRGPHRWRTDLSRVLRLTDDEDAVYAWAYDPDPDDEGDEIFETQYLSFKVCVTDADGATRWYGQNAAAAPGAMPPTIEAVPAVTDALALAASEADAVPIVVPLATVPNSHITVELNLASETSPEYSLCGSYWQDFNTWYATSDRFASTEFRENVHSRTADFDCTVGSGTSSAIVDDGWIPDEGPLADTTSFTETFAVGRGDIQRGEYPFFMQDGTYIARSNFRQWGAGGDRADPRYLREGETDSDYSTYVEFAKGAEVVLRRSWTRLPDGTYSPDAQLRLRGEGQGVWPRSDGGRGVTLNGVGAVSFTLGLSIPYDIGHRVRLLDAASPSLLGDCYGVAAGVQIDNPSRNCAASGYSVSYYLEDALNNRTYELRVTQIVDFRAASGGSTDEDEPQASVVAELYQWQGSTPTRIAISTTLGGAASTDGYYAIGNSLSGRTYGLWVTADGYLAAGSANNNTATTLTAQFYSSTPLLAGTTPLLAAVGSAECRPTFRFVSRRLAVGNDYSGSPVSPDAVRAQEPSAPAWANGCSWTFTSDSQNSAYLRIIRKTPSAEAAGQVKVWAKGLDGTGDAFERLFSAAETDVPITVTVGAANAELHIAPANEESNIFIDNLAVSSWCGNDANRNGDERVPTFTDAGFVSANGFAGVGLWIRPVDDNQLNVSAANYRGEQCVLLQRSRQNTSDGLSGEVLGPGADYYNTGSSLALYGPWSDGDGFGAVSFRYRIPSQDEYGDQGALPSVYVMLQYLNVARYTNNFLNDPPSGWVNVSDPIELHNTAGEWSTASITPRNNGEELVGVSGILRLVMVIPADRVNDRSYDPYVYIDDFTVTDNQAGTLASWTAINVLLTDSPISYLYWKDRAATGTAEPPEETFAEKSSLTRAFQFNDTTEADDTEPNQSTSLLNSPPLENGVGRVTFAARLSEPQANPVRLYLFASESAESDATDFQVVTYVEVTNTVYNVYDVDLSKFTRYMQRPNADLTPDLTSGNTDFRAGDIRRIRFQVYLDGDGTDTDAFGDHVNHGRLLIDRLAVSDPVQPTLRVESVAFSNAAGENIPSAFDPTSPLSQPVSDTPVLRTMVTLGRQQLLKPDTIRVFLTYDPQTVGGVDGLSRFTTNYTYQDILGHSVTATTSSPVFAWDTNKLDAWPLSAWFSLTDSFDRLDPAGQPGPLTSEELLALGLPNTVELTRGPADDDQHFFGDLSSTGLPSLPPNSLVRYTAWAVYQSAESDQWFYTQISPADYTEYPWYFPRNLNAEIRAHKNADLAADEDPVGADFFSPYYWVYSCIPGEVFINEFNLADPGNANPSLANFVEICAPVSLDLAGWRAAVTLRNTTEPSVVMQIPQTAEGSAIADGVALEAPDPGAVPSRRGVTAGTSANRSFYTAYDNNCALYYREGGTQHTDRKPYKNAGLAGDYTYFFPGSGGASSLLLYRPTGGAEHIVVFSTAIGNNSAQSTQDELEELHAVYQGAYVTGGFGSEWYQAFLDTDWDAETVTYDDVNISAREHARRLAVADVYKADANDRYSRTGTNDRYVQDNDQNTGSYPNSIATVDMGGKWVTRRNAIEGVCDNGPTDLTHILTGDWDADNNPTVDTRFPEPDGADASLRPVVQVTPRQINPDQYLVPYSGLSQCSVTSTILAGLGQHTLEVLEDGAVVSTRRAGRASPTSWSVDSSGEPHVRLTYAALPFHVIASVSVRMRNPEGDGSYFTDLGILGDQFPGLTLGTPDDEGWCAVTVPADATTFDIEALLYPVGNPSSDLRYGAEARVTFALRAEDARGIITNVAPFCGDALTGSSQSQPWWGSGFGFTASYDAATLAQAGATLSSVLILYPDPVHAAEPTAMDGIAAGWTGANFTYTPAVTDPDADPADPVTVALEGMEYAAATNTLATVLGPNAGTRYVELRSGADGRLSDPSLVGILADSYARAAGYDGTAATATKKEPAIPYIAWGVYTVTVPADRGNETVSFLLRQALPGELPGVFAYPTWYAPLADLNASKPAENTIPYFYLYSTPPQAAWLSEVNPAQADGSEPYVEAVLPNLRQGILDAGVPAVDGIGWFVRYYEQTGASRLATSLPATYTAESGSTAYHYYTATITQNLSPVSAYVLHRPCGAGEGGVWTGVDADGDTEVPRPASLTENGWLLDATSYVVPGVTDSNTKAGSVQLVGQLVYDDGSNVGRISSDVSMRTQWAFTDESRDADNEGIRPDTRPDWNQVTFTSSLRNAAFGSGLCGYQMVPGFFESAAAAGITTNATLSLSGGEWVYSADRNVVFSYRPRTGYCFDSITLPPDLIGHVMLIGGANGVLSQATVTDEWERLTAMEQAATDEAARQAIRLNQWLTLGGRASLETRTVTNADGTVTVEPTGVIRFNLDFEDGDGTFADRDDFVVTLLFVDEPSSAQNAVTVSFTQGNIGAGAWLVTQTLFAFDADGVTPDPDKGGGAVSLPIWSDENGDANGDNANVHGWLYQPTVGDTIGMTAVLDPELGLVGGTRIGSTLEDVYGNLAASGATLRPFLVWTLIPRNKVPTNLFDATLANSALVNRGNFLNAWSIERWVGNVSVAENLTPLNLTQFRRDLQRNVGIAQGGSGGNVLYNAAGIIPMTLQGYCGPGQALTPAPTGGLPSDYGESLRLSYRTMTQTELDAALADGSFALANDADDLLPYTATIPMTDRSLWQDGAILRFAIILADPGQNLIYDVQGISNFTSEAFPGYCPWYVPDESSNVNAVSASEEAGVSPYAWVYALGQNGVWLNEIRPFQRRDAEGNAIPSAVELAMTASYLDDGSGNYVHPADLTRADQRFLPRETLDGWRIVTKYAPLPLASADPSTPLQWTEHRSFPLTGWVPYRRIRPAYDTTAAGANTAFYDLDYYVVTTSTDHGFGYDQLGNFHRNPYTGTEDSLNSFTWLPATAEFFEADLPDTLAATADHTLGTVFAVALVRNNGVVSDEVLFVQPPKAPGFDTSTVAARLAVAVESENVNHAAANTVRAYTGYPASVGASIASMQFVDWRKADGSSSLLWYVDSVGTSAANTFPGANAFSDGTWTFRQPYVEYVIPFTTSYSVTAQLLGGNGALALSVGATGANGRSVAATGRDGDALTLAVSEPWDERWFTLQGITKNGQPFTPQVARATRYAVNAAGTLAATPQTTIDAATLQGDTDYVLTLVYTPDAAKLQQAGALESADGGFLDWLLESDPAAILSQTAADGVTASEKYWLGFDAADYDATDLSLRFTLVGTHQEGEGETLPAVSVALTDAQTPIRQIRGDGALVLLGKESLDDPEWRFIQSLQPEDVNGERLLILRTECKFFRAVLLSQKREAQLRRKE